MIIDNKSIFKYPIARTLKYKSTTQRLFSKVRRHKTETTAAAKKLHQIPGALIYTGEETSQDIKLEVIQFDEEYFDEYIIESGSLKDLKEQKGVLWLNIIGLHDAKLIEEIGEHFSFHNLALEDVMNIHHRPSYDEYDDHIVVSAKMLQQSKDTLSTEQLSFIMGKDYIITFQERPGDVFEGVRNRLRNKKGRIRSRRADYLVFALLDVIVDKYLAILATYDETIHEQEVKLLDTVNDSILAEINSSKREINYLRKYARPLKEAIHNFSRSHIILIEKRTRPFIKDLMDHINHVNEGIEMNRETINDNLSAYHSQMSNKLNDILKVLTIFSVVFIPLTFLAGIYGMNFEYMPELHYEYSYPAFWVTLVLVTGGMLFYFKRKRWL